MCWGLGNTGAHGLNNSIHIGYLGTLSTLSMIKFSDTIPAVQVSVSQHVCVLFSNQRVRCFGNNGSQQLGDTTFLHKGVAADHRSVSKSVFVDFSPSINSLPIISVSVGS